MFKHLGHARHGLGPTNRWFAAWQQLLFWTNNTRLRCSDETAWHVKCCKNSVLFCFCIFTRHKSCLYFKLFFITSRWYVSRYLSITVYITVYEYHNMWVSLCANIMVCEYHSKCVSRYLSITVCENHGVWIPRKSVSQYVSITIWIAVCVYYCRYHGIWVSRYVTRYLSITICKYHSMWISLYVSITVCITIWWWSQDILQPFATLVRTDSYLCIS